MSIKNKNAETKVANESQVAAAQVGAVKPSVFMKASAKQAQDKVNKALTAAELAKKKAQEEEEAKLAEERAAQEAAEAGAAAEEGSSESVAQGSLVEDEEAVAKADETTVEDIEAVAKQLDETAAGLDIASRDLGMMFAQAGSTGSGAAAVTLGGLNTGTIIGGIAALGVVVAASDSDSSSAAPVTTTPPAPTPSTCAIVATPIALNALMSDPAPITVPVLATPAAVASVTTVGESATATGAALTAASFSPTDFSEEDATVRIAYTGTSQSQVLRIASSVLSTDPGVAASVDITEAGSGYTPGTYSVELEGGSGEGAEAVVVVDEDGQIESITITNGGEGYVAGDALTFASAAWNSNVDVEVEFEVDALADLDGVEIDGAGGNDTVRLTTTDDVDNLYLSNVEVLQVVAEDDVVIDTSTFTGVGELWNWTSVAGNALEFTGVSSTATVIGLRATDASTTVVYDTTVTGSGEVTVVLSRTVAGADLDLDTSEIETGTLNAVRLSSNGTIENNLSLQNTGGDIATVTVVGSADLSLSINGADVAGLTTLNAAGLSGDLTIEQQAVGNLDFAIVGGSGATTVNVLLDGDGDLNLTRVQVVNVEVDGGGSIDFAGSAGVGAVVLTDGAADDVGLVNLAIGTDIEVDGANLDSLALDYAQLSDATITMGDDSVVTTELTVEGARSVFLETANDVTLGTISVDTASLLSIDASGNVEAGNIENSGDGSFIVRLGSSAAAGNASFENIDAAGDLYVNIVATGSGGNGDISVEEITSSGGMVTLSTAASTSDISVSHIVADATVSVSATAASTKADGGNEISIGNIESVLGDVVLELVAQGVSDSAPATSVITVGNISTDTAAVSISATLGTNAFLGLGNIDSATTVYLNVNADRNSAVSIGNIEAETGAALGVTLSINEGGASVIGSVLSDNGDIALAFALPSSSNDNVSELSVGDITASDGNVFLHAIDFGTVSVGNAGVVVTTVGTGAELALGTISADEEGYGVEIGCEDHVIALGRGATFSVDGVLTDANFSLEHIAVAGSGANLDFGDIESLSGSISVALGSDYIDTRVQFGALDAQTSVSVEYLSLVSGGNIDIGAVTTQEGAVSADITVGRDSAVSLAQVDSGLGVTIDLVSGATSELSISTVDAEGVISVSISSGVEATVTVDDITSATGDVNIELQIASTASDESTVTFDAITAGDDGNVSISGDSSVGSNGDVSFGNISADGSGGTVSVGTLTDAVTLGVNSTFAIGNISADGDITAFFSTSTGSEVTLGTVTVESLVGGITVDVEGNNQSVSFNLANTTVDQDIELDIRGGGSEGNIDIGDLLTREGSISLRLATGSDGNIDVGTGIADDPGQSISIIATAGANSDVNIGDQTADDFVTLTVSTSAGGSFDIGNIEVNTGELSLDTGIRLDLTLGSSAGQLGDGSVGNLDASSGDIVVSAVVANSGTLDFLGTIAAEEGSVVFGSVATTAVEVGVNAVITTDGAIEAEGDLSIFLSLQQGANAEFLGNLESVGGQIDLRVDADYADTKVIIDGSSTITALENIDIDVTAGTNGNIEITTTSGLHSLTGNVDIDLAVGRNTTTEAGITIDGNIEATGTDVFDVDPTNISISVVAGSGSEVSIASGYVITADGEVVVDLTLGQGVDGSASHLLANSGAIESNFGDITLTLRLDSSNSSANAEATLDVGDLTAYNGDVVIVGGSSDSPLEGTYVGTNGSMTIEDIIAGNDVLIGAESTRVHVLFGGDTGTAESTFEVEDIETSLGDVEIYLELETGASFSVASIDAATRFAGSGDVTIDIETHFYTLADLSSIGSDINIGAIDASGDVSITIISAEPLMPDVGINDQGSPNITLDEIDGDSFTLVYEGYAVPGELTVSGIVDVDGVFDATVSGTADVTIDDFNASSVVVDASDLDGILTFADDNDVGGLVIGGRNSDVITAGSSSTTFRINAVGDEVGDSFTGGASIDTMDFLLEGDYNLRTALIDDVENFTFTGESTVTIVTASIDDSDTLDFSSSGTSVLIIGDAGSTYDFTNDSFTNFSIRAGLGVDLTLGNQTTNVLSVIDLSGSASNTVVAGDGSWEITGGSGVDDVTVGNGSSVLNLGAGSNVVSATSAAAIEVTTLSGADDITIVGGGDNLLDLGSGADTVSITGGGSNEVTAGSGANDITIVGSGDNVITNVGSTETVTIDITGNGANDITTGTGSDDITVTGNGANVITSSSGDDTIEVIGNGANVISSSAGDNSITVTGDGANTITTGTGSDMILVVGDGANVISSGGGADVIDIDGDGASDITTGTGGDEIIVELGSYTGLTESTAITITDFDSGSDDLTIGITAELADYDTGTTTYSGNMLVSAGTYANFAAALSDAADAFTAADAVDVNNDVTGLASLELFMARGSGGTSWLFVDDGVTDAVTHVFVFSNNVTLGETNIA